MSDEQYPIGGDREAVYNALRRRGFVESGWSDKHWTRSDGLKVRVYGSGSKLAVLRDKESVCDGPMADSLKTIDEIDLRTSVRRLS